MARPSLAHTRPRVNACLGVCCFRVPWGQPGVIPHAPPHAAHVKSYVYSVYEVHGVHVRTARCNSSIASASVAHTPLRERMHICVLRPFAMADTWKSSPIAPVAAHAKSYAPGAYNMHIVQVRYLHVTLA